MKTEDFDDAIKRKLESINPTFNEADIERVHQYSIKNRGPFSMLRTSRFIWPVMGAGMLLTAILTWKITTMYEQRQPVVQQIVNQNTTPVLPKITETKTADLKTITKTDSTSPSKTENSNPVPDKYPSYKAYTQNSKIASTSKTNKQHAPASAGKVYASSQTAIDPKMSHNNNSPLSHISTDQPDMLNNKPVENKSGKNNVSGKLSSDNKSDNTVDNKSNNITDNKIVKANDTLTVAAKNPEEKKDEPTTDITKKAPVHNYSDEHTKPGSSKPSLKISGMFGLGCEYALTQTGAGAFVKILANNQFSLNAGFKVMSVNHRYYAGDDQFQQATGYDFKWTYARELSPNCEISNINFTYSLMQIPLAIEYYYPLKKNWTLSASVGTDLDISCASTLKYTATETYASDGPKPYDQTYDYSTILFNNLDIALGVSKQFGPIAIEASPFTSFQIDKAWYKGNSNLFYGGNVKVFYCF